MMMPSGMLLFKSCMTMLSWEWQLQKTNAENSSFTQELFFKHAQFTMHVCACTPTYAQLLWNFPHICKMYKLKLLEYTRAVKFPKAAIPYNGKIRQGIVTTISGKQTSKLTACYHNLLVYVWPIWSNTTSLANGR